MDSIALAARGIAGPRDMDRRPIILPEKLSLRDNYDETVACIEALRDHVFEQGVPVMLYFNHVRHLEPAAVLLLTAEIFRCRNLRAYRRGVMVSGNYPAVADVFLQLRELGFYATIGVDEFSTVPDDREREGRPYFLRFKSFKNVDGEFAANFCDLVLPGIMELGRLAKTRMVGALKEAMGNANEHAYKMSTDLPSMKGRWWLTGYVDPTSKEMMVILLDQGVGIPRTLPPSRFEQICAAVTTLSRTPSDGNMIAAATELHRTSTGSTTRGKGFADMKGFVDTCDDGELRVLSNKGRYEYMKGAVQIADERRSIGGTLVEWRVRHSAVLES